ncbi:hypothetical protein M405DRAFT_354718 [Rhizopogon salebrosus TDB-379]|nr:hypothetical protein M405DRAFT_354718 [Rhizopogon salebrosus TDB-379]
MYLTYSGTAARRRLTLFASLRRVSQFFSPHSFSSTAKQPCSCYRPWFISRTLHGEQRCAWVAKKRHHTEAHSDAHQNPRREVNAIAARTLALSIWHRSYT